jgi:peptidoglycan hydrolase CwlO-like protein
MFPKLKFDENRINNLIKRYVGDVKAIDEKIGEFQEKIEEEDNKIKEAQEKMKSAVSNINDLMRQKLLILGSIDALEGVLKGDEKEEA